MSTRRPMTKREKVLSWLVGGTFAFLLNLFVLQYFFQTNAKLTADRTQAQVQLGAMEKLLAVIRGEHVEKLTKVAPQLILRASTIARRP